MTAQKSSAKSRGRKVVFLVALGTGGWEYQPVRVKNRRLRSVKLPAEAYAFYFYDRYIINENGTEVLGPEENRSKTHVVGELVPAEHVSKLARQPLAKLAARDMEQLGATSMILLRHGYVPYHGESVIPPQSIGGYLAAA